MKLTKEAMLKLCQHNTAIMVKSKLISARQGKKRILARKKELALEG